MARGCKQSTHSYHITIRNHRYVQDVEKAGDSRFFALQKSSKGPAV